MSIDSYKASIWEAALLTEFRGVSVANVITTSPSQIKGAKMIFNVISGGTIKDYTGTVAYDTATTAPIELPFDKKKYFAMSIDDVDAVQAAGPVLSVIAQEKALDLKEAQDQLVYTEFAAGLLAGNTIGTVLAPIEITTSSDAYDNLVDLSTAMSKNKVPTSGRYAIASAEYINLMAKDVRFADNFSVLPNGIVQGATVGGFTLIQTEDAPDGMVLGIHKSAIGYGTQLDQVEALRLEGSFSDAIRGLQVSGVKTLRPKALAALHYEIAIV